MSIFLFFGYKSSFLLLRFNNNNNTYSFCTTKQVEGEIDKLSLEEVGFLNCVSVPDGAPAKVSPKELPHEEEVLISLKYKFILMQFFVLIVGLGSLMLNLDLQRMQVGICLDQDFFKN